MVTITIAEEDDTMKTLLYKTLKAKGQKIYRRKPSADCDYLLLDETQRKKSDILLLHNQSCVPGADYITLMNADRKLSPPTDKKSLIITYGLNPLATITASSVDTDGEKTTFLCCLQRSIVTLKGKILEPQEFPVTLPEDITDLATFMGFVCLGLVLSFTPDDFS